MNFIKILSVVAIGIIAALCAAASASPISSIDSAHLVERALREQHNIRHRTISVEQSTCNNHPAYIVTGISGDDGYRSIVDAQVARVMEIEQNGEKFYEWGGPLVVGHRGTVKYAPENTLPAFKAAIEHGCDLLEIDIRETKDGELVIIHDSTLDRTTNGSGPVSEHTLAEIKQLDAGSWFSDEFKNTRVPTLREALEFMKGKALPDLDFKAGDPKKLVKIIKEEGLLGKVTMHCGDWDLLQQTQAITDQFLLRPGVPVGVAGLPILLDKFDPPIVNIDWGQFNEALVREVHLAGRKSFVNTMQHDDAFGIQAMLDVAPDYIQSDEIEILVPLMRARGLKN
ncbi:MAG: glycerophosphodiester phosphodiesterase family protein [Candidatus Hinthialibacter antarcticus]|nr:glycerophosphodiester phosphodiesterase family protein [Candidatus Hinthialibacter antarcticus]